LVFQRITFSYNFHTVKHFLLCGWYWLYAAVSCRSLLVTNDEMRDHLFQLLGTSFFPRWKENIRCFFSSPSSAMTSVLSRMFRHCGHLVILWNLKLHLGGIHSIFCQCVFMYVILGNSLQVRLTFSGRGPTLHMPPPYSIVIQVSR
jgi:hypothetical protein